MSSRRARYDRWIIHFQNEAARTLASNGACSSATTEDGRAKTSRRIRRMTVDRTDAGHVVLQCRRANQCGTNSARGMRGGRSERPHRASCGCRKSAPPRSPRKKSRSSESRCTDGELPFAGRANALPDRRATERGARGAHATRAGRSGRRIPPAAAQKVRPASPAEHKSRSRRKVDAAGHPRPAAGRDAAPGAPRECARHGPSVPQRPAEESARDVHAPPPARRQKVITCAPGILATIGQR